MSMIEGCFQAMGRKSAITYLSFGINLSREIESTLISHINLSLIKAIKTYTTQREIMCG